MKGRGRSPGPVVADFHHLEEEIDTDPHYSEKLDPDPQ
jgi:hypothetical protein